MSANQAARMPTAWPKSSRTRRYSSGATNSEAMPLTTKAETSGSRSATLTAPTSHGKSGKKTM